MVVHLFILPFQSKNCAAKSLHIIAIVNTTVAPIVKLLQPISCIIILQLFLVSLLSYSKLTRLTSIRLKKNKMTSYTLDSPVVQPAGFKPGPERSGVGRLCHLSD